MNEKCLTSMSLRGRRRAFRQVPDRTRYCVLPHHGRRDVELVGAADEERQEFDLADPAAAHVAQARPWAALKLRK